EQRGRPRAHGRPRCRPAHQHARAIRARRACRNREMGESSEGRSRARGLMRVALSCPPMIAVVIVLTIALGLVLDEKVGLWGQLAVSVGVWALFLVLAARAAHRERVALIACLAYATAGELFLSLVWGLYSYRLDNVPLFVPP